MASSSSPSRSVRFAADSALTTAAASLNDPSTSTALVRKEANAPAASSQQLTCPNCGSKEIEHHEPSGASICTDCGVVVEENAIVSSVEFVEGAGGSSSMVGQFVSATASKAYTGARGGATARGGRYGFSRDSRETTLANGRRRIQDVASRLRLSSHYVDAAHRLFTIAVEKNFVQGRRTTHVVAACLYIACRQEKSQHMLIDFSDALQVNVYTLGTCFLKFRRLLGLKLEIIDPALYVYRFAAHLDLDSKANAVALTALRLVGRMKRDWIVAGRRPAGICAAALLIAARAHGFSRHQQDVTKILRVCGLTVNTRVKEFEHTPSAHLTLEQFNSVELETEADPPVFTRNRIMEVSACVVADFVSMSKRGGALF
jgi:transcription factor IIIB subunit 2